MVIRWINYNLNWKYQNEFRAAVLAFNRTEKPNHFNIVGCANDSQRLSMHKNVCVCGGERAPMAWVEQNKSRYISVRAQYEKQKTESGNKRANRNDSSTNCGTNINWNVIDEWLKLIMKYTKRATNNHSMAIIKFNYYTHWICEARFTRCERACTSACVCVYWSCVFVYGKSRGFFSTSFVWVRKAFKRMWREYFEFRCN